MHFGVTHSNQQFLFDFSFSPMESDQRPGTFITNFWEKDEVILTGQEWLRKYLFCCHISLSDFSLLACSNAQRFKTIVTVLGN